MEVQIETLATPPSGDLERILSTEDIPVVESEVEKYVAKITSEIDAGIINPSMSTKEFARIINERDRVNKRLKRFMHRTIAGTNSYKNSDAEKRLKDRYRILANEFSDASRRFESWLKGIGVDGLTTLDDTNFHRLVAVVSVASDYLSFQRARGREHTLQADVEEFRGRIVGVVDTGLERMLNQLGKTHPQPKPDLTGLEGRERLRTLFKARLAANEKAAQDYFPVLETNARLWDLDAEEKGHPRPISTRNYSNQISDKSVDSFLQIADREENLAIIRRWFDFIRREKRIPEGDFGPWDMGEPQNPSQKISFEKGLEIVLTAFERISPEYARLAKHIVENNLIDAEDRENKEARPLTYWIGDGDVYITLKYTGSLQSVGHLAQELAHGVHCLLAKDTYRDALVPPIIFAKAVSLFAENFVIDHLIETAETDEQKKAALEYKMFNIFSKLFAQPQYAIFEEKAHEVMTNGILDSGKTEPRTATVTDISNLFGERKKRIYGTAMVFDEKEGHGWRMIPYFFGKQQFEAYSYGIGYAMALSFGNEFTQDPTGFISQLIEIQKLGGSKALDKLLEERRGIDLDSEEFWQKAYDSAREVVVKMEALEKTT